MHMNFFLLKMWFDYLKKRSKGLADLWGNSRTIKNGPKSDRTTHSLKKLFNHLQIGHKNNWLGVVRPRLHFIIFLIVFIFVVRGNLCSFQVKKKKNKSHACHGGIYFSSILMSDAFRTMYFLKIYFLKW
jgi:hypothetical protein